VGIKSRLNWRVEYCMRGKCIHNNEGACLSPEYCIRFSMYEEAREDNDELQQLPKQDLPDRGKTLSGDGEVST